MKRMYLLLSILCMFPLQVLPAKMSFVVEGPEDTYNCIFVINETSQPNFRCRLVVLGKDNSTERIIGIYNLIGINDSDSNTRVVKKGMRIGIDLPKDFKKELVFTIEYKDYPLYDAIVVHLCDKESEFNED